MRWNTHRRWCCNDLSLLTHPNFSCHKTTRFVLHSALSSKKEVLQKITTFTFFGSTSYIFTVEKMVELGARNFLKQSTLAFKVLGFGYLLKDTR